MKSHKVIAVTGLNAVLAIALHRPHLIERLFFIREIAFSLRELCQDMAHRQKVYRMVTSDELAKISESVHHGGVAAICAIPPYEVIKGIMVQDWINHHKRLLILDSIGNSHNLGAVIRSAAFLGWRTILLSGKLESMTPSPSVFRVSEGGMEHVSIYHCPNLIEFIRHYHSDFCFIATSHKGKKPLREFLSQTPPDQPIAVIMGNEEQGLDQHVTHDCHYHIAIEGSQKVESLNISAASAILLYTLSQTT